MLKRTHYSNEVQPGDAVLSGWVHTVRDLGNIKFIVLRDAEGIAQVTVKKGVVKDELLELGARHAHTRDIREILFHPGFPVDIRHNAKIGRPELARWAARRLRRRARRR